MKDLLTALAPTAQERIQAALQVENTLASYGESDPKGTNINENKNNRRMIAYDLNGEAF